jgi:hypothetical protein
MSWQVDKLVQLLESPIFLHLRLQLLEPNDASHPALLKSLYVPPPDARPPPPSRAPRRT